MWFKNLYLLRLDEWNHSSQDLEALLSRRPLQPCSGADHQSAGWVPLKEGKFVHACGDHVMFMMGAERKLLPASVIAQYAKARAEEIEETQGYKPGRKQMREIRDEVTDELLPRAFSIRRTTAAWVDMKNG